MSETTSGPASHAPRETRPALTRVVVRNYRSIAACDVSLGPLTFLVGPNGSGKSNFLDALRFVAEALRDTLDLALRQRGGIDAVRRRGEGMRPGFRIELDCNLPAGGRATYGLELSATSFGGFNVVWEACSVFASGGALVASFEVKDRQVSISVPIPPAHVPNRLYLVNAAGLPEFAPVYDMLSRLAFYRPNPDVIRRPVPPDTGEVLAADAGNLPSVVARLWRDAPETKLMVDEYLRLVVPGLVQVDRRSVGSLETLAFRQRLDSAERPVSFEAAQMSDGTLRCLAVLVALFQGHANGAGVTLVGIEEPEMALHPAAFGVLRSALRQASQSAQVLVTSHSPELLDDPEIAADEIRAVVLKDGATRIGPLDAAGRTVLAEHLFTAGELLQVNQLQPEHVGSSASAGGAA